MNRLAAMSINTHAEEDKRLASRASPRERKRQRIALDQELAMRDAGSVPVRTLAPGPNRLRGGRKRRRRDSAEVRELRGRIAQLEQQIKRTGSSADFYDSAPWQRARYEALCRSNGRCELCGASKADGATIQVDHIKPRSKFPALELDTGNLQVLCRPCNMGKSNRDETDWRKPELKAVRGI